MSGPQRIPGNGQPQQVNIPIQIEPDRMNFIVLLQRATGAPHSQIVNDMLLLAILQVQTAQLSMQFAASLTQLPEANPAPEAAPPDPDDLDTRTPEQRLADLKKTASGEATEGSGAVPGPKPEEPS